MQTRSTIQFLVLCCLASTMVKDQAVFDIVLHRIFWKFGDSLMRMFSLDPFLEATCGFQVADIYTQSLIILCILIFLYWSRTILSLCKRLISVINKIILSPHCFGRNLVGLQFALLSECSFLVSYCVAWFWVYQLMHHF